MHCIVIQHGWNIIKLNSICTPGYCVDLPNNFAICCATEFQSFMWHVLQGLKWANNYDYNRMHAWLSLKFWVKFDDRLNWHWYFYICRNNWNAGRKMTNTCLHFSNRMCRLAVGVSKSIDLFHMAMIVVHIIFLESWPVLSTN